MHYCHLHNNNSTKNKRKATPRSCGAHQKSSNCLYEDVSHRQSASSVIDTRKDVAYGQIAL